MSEALRQGAMMGAEWKSGRTQPHIQKPPGGEKGDRAREDRSGKRKG